jgi:sterol desaturase/sphingolipid hydroxylase (fatty acid hydroxylase superfamily)
MLKMHWVETGTLVRASVFLIVFAILAIIEVLTPRRRLSVPKIQRWRINLSIIALNPLSVALVFPFLPIGLALLTSEQGWGLLNQWALPYWLKIIIGFVVLDFVIYMHHVLHHTLPTLWRLHMMHHADLDFDLTTGLRFHPIEVIISTVIKLAAVAALGVPPIAVLAFEVALNATSMFNHSNIVIPVKADRRLRLLVVTPDMHRVHHSVIIKETNSNFGFNLPWWDRLFGTYKDQPDKGHTDMVIGLSQFREQRKLSLPRLLILPFTGNPGIVPINRH